MLRSSIFEQLLTEIDFYSDFPKIFIMSIFIVINVLIMRNDILYKKIPNQYLLFLLLLLPAYLFIIPAVDNRTLLGWGIGVLVSLGIGFGTYILHGWAPGDGKYFIILSLFLLGDNQIISFTGNTAALAVGGIVIGTLLKKLNIFGNNTGVILPPKKDAQKKINTPKGGKVLVFLIQIIGSLLFTIYFREYILGEMRGGIHIGIDLTVILFIGYILIRQITNYGISLGKKYSKKRGEIIAMGFFCIPIIIGFLYKQERIFYYFYDILKYGLPTILLVNFFIKYLLKVFRTTEMIEKNYNTMDSEDTPTYVIANGKRRKVSNRDDIIKICAMENIEKENVAVFIAKTHPFGHYIFLGFFLSAYLHLHLSYTLLHSWFLFLEKTWNFIITNLP